MCVMLHWLYTELSANHKAMLTNESNLFVEDAAVGTFGCVRVGVRVVSTDPAYALIARSLLVPLPPRDCDHRARWALSELIWPISFFCRLFNFFLSSTVRFDGWNLDPLWQTEAPERKWDGEKYLFNEVSAVFTSCYRFYRVNKSFFLPCFVEPPTC